MRVCEITSRESRQGNRHTSCPLELLAGRSALRKCARPCQAVRDTQPCTLLVDFFFFGRIETLPGLYLEGLELVGSNSTGSP